MEFANEWLWIIFLSAGLVLMILELIVGIEAGFDLVIIGSVFIIGGLATWPAESWIITIVVISLISVAYLFLGRKYVHRKMQIKGAKTNIDTIIGQKGIVLRPIMENSQGLVKVGYEEWRAKADEEIGEGDEIVVTEIAGVTLKVKKNIGGIE